MNVRIASAFFVGPLAEREARAWLLASMPESQFTPVAQIIPPNGGRDYGSLRSDVAMGPRDDITLVLNYGKVYVVDKVRYDDTNGSSYVQADCHIYNGTNDHSYICSLFNQ